ncbi:MAG: hypothetical protein LBQ87_08065 [Candidatus Fibromonas sp.]|nr:hypothetical protein [Candidatus Fibromonas sp.]
MTMPNTITAQLYSMSFRTSKKKISKLLNQKSKEAMKSIDSILDTADRYLANHVQPLLKRGKALSSKAAETSKIGILGVFAGVFCVLFALIYTIICYANRRE